MATHSSVLAWRIPGMGEPGGLPSMGSHKVGNDEGTAAAAAERKPPYEYYCQHFPNYRLEEEFEERAHVKGEGNGNPLQFSCPENPVDGGAW